MTTALPYAVTDVVGLPETRLPDEFAATLPTSVAAAPWQTRCQVVSWLHPVDDAALDAFPEAIRPARAGTVAWALVRYGATPVGPYSEIAATLIADEAAGYGHIPFIVVDSKTSIVGGRANWLLPKALAGFDWSEDGRSVAIAGSVPATPAWTISVRYAPSGDGIDMSMPNQIQQVSAAGVVRRFDGTITGSLFAASIEVEGHADGPLATLLRPGRYDGTVISRCEFDVGPLHPA